VICDSGEIGSFVKSSEKKWPYILDLGYTKGAGMKETSIELRIVYAEMELKFS